MVNGVSVEWGMCSHTVTMDSNPWTLVCWRDTVAIGLQSGCIVILDGITGSQAAIFSGHVSEVNSLAFSSDGVFLVSGSDDQTVKLWDVQTGGVVKTFHGHTDCVLSVSISADCTTIASGSFDKTIRLWNIQTRECQHIVEQHEWIYHVSFSPTDPQHFISVSGCKIHHWHINGHQTGHTHNGSHVAVSLDGTQLVLCQGAAVVVQNSDSGAIMAEFHIANCKPSCCCFSPDGRLVAVADDSTVYIWEIAGSDPHIVETFIRHTSYITSLTFSSPSTLISSSCDQSIKFWQITTSPTNQVDSESPPLAPALIKSITLKAKDGIIISSDSEGVVKIWDTSTGHCNASFQTPAKDHHESDVQLVNGRLIFVWQVDEKICIWDVEKGEPLQMVEAPWGDIDDIRISGDGSKVFCLCWISIQAWSVQTGEHVGEVEFEFSDVQRSLTVNGSRVWVHSPSVEPQGWDFGIPGVPPVQLSSMSSLYLSDTKLWDTCLSRIKDAVTGRVVFQLGGRFTQPVDVQWDGQYLAARYRSGEMLVLDFNHMLPKD